MATIMHYIRSNYDPNDREALELATGQVPSTTHSDAPEDHTEESEIDPWQTEKAFGVERRLAAAPRFVPAAVSYDAVNNMLGGMPRAVLDAPVEESKEDVSGWYRSLTRRSVAGEKAAGATSSTGKVQQNKIAGSSRSNTAIEQTTTSIAQPRPDKNTWFISRALQSEPTSTTSTPPPTLADILAREPPIPKKPMEPPVFLALGPSNRGWGMLQQKGWSEGEGLGANVARRAQYSSSEQKQPVASSSRIKREAGAMQVKSERQEVQLDSDGEICEMRDVEVVDLTLSDDEEREDEADIAQELGHATPASFSREPSPHSKPLLTPIPTILKSDRLGIGLKAKKVGPYKESKKRVTHNQAALAAHIRASEEMRRVKALVGRGSRGFARTAKAESEQRRQLLASLNAP